MKNLWRAGLLALRSPTPRGPRAGPRWATCPRRSATGRRSPSATRRASPAVSVLSPEVVRVRFVPKPEFGRDHSYAVVGKLPGDPAAAFDVQADRTTIRTAALTVTVKHAPLRVSFATASGESLDEDDASRGIGFVDETVRVWKRLRDDELVYGFGEKIGRLNKRGRNLGGYTYVNVEQRHLRATATTPTRSTRRSRSTSCCATAARTASSSTTRTAASSTSGASRSACSRSAPRAASSTTTSSTARRRSEVVARYTQLTGRMPLPPRWSLGYHQCRYSYYPESRVRLHRRQRSARSRSPPT